MRIYLKVKPGQRFDKVEKLADGWQIRLRAPAVDSKANEHLIAYLSEVLQLPKSAISLLKGQTSRIKCLDINAGEDHVLEALSKAAGIG